MSKAYFPFIILLALHFSSCAPSKEAQLGGIALYTLKEEMKADAKKTLKEVAKLGYAYVEAAGYENGTYYGMSPEEFKLYLNEIGLEPRSTHQSSITLENADTQIRDAKAAGFKYFVIPVPPMGHFKLVSTDPLVLSMSTEVELVTEIINTLGKKCSDAGLQLLYHNHDFEFVENENGVVPIDYFLTHTDPAYVNYEMDLYWVTKAGVDPIAYMQKYPGRFKAWHLKDMDTLGRFAPVGTGSIDFKSILAKKEVSGMDSYFVEQDATFNETPMEAIKISHDALKEIGFK